MYNVYNEECTVFLLVMYGIYFSNGMEVILAPKSVRNVRYFFFKVFGILMKCGRRPEIYPEWSKTCDCDKKTEKKLIFIPLRGILSRVFSQQNTYFSISEHSVYFLYLKNYYGGGQGGWTLPPTFTDMSATNCFFMPSFTFSFSLFSQQTYYSVCEYWLWRIWSFGFCRSKNLRGLVKKETKSERDSIRFKTVSDQEENAVPLTSLTSLLYLTYFLIIYILHTGNFIKKVPTATGTLRDR